MMVILLLVVLAGVGIMIDTIGDSPTPTAVPKSGEVQSTPPNDTPIGEERGPYR